MDPRKLETLIEIALGDGVLTKYEWQDIKFAMNDHHKITEEEMSLWRAVAYKIWQGEIKIEDRH